MNTRILLLVFFFLIFPKQDVYSQLGFSNEVGILMGPVAFYSDYGVRNDFETNSGNVGFGIGLMHYINFSYRAVFEVGSQLEYFPFSIRDFMADAYKIAPFISAGLHWVNYDPEAYTEFGTGNIESAANVPDKYIGAFQQEPGTTWAFVTSVGARYKLSQRSDIMLEARWQYYFSNWVDGLNPSFEANQTVQVP